MLIALIWGWDLGEHGLATSELPSALRAQALANGEALQGSGSEILSGLLLRLDSEALATSSWGHALLRAPHWLSALVLVGLTMWWGRLRELAPPMLGLIAAAFPVVGTASRHLQPDLWPEVALSLWLCLGHRAQPFPRTLSILAQGLALTLLAWGAGLWWGWASAFTLLWLSGAKRGWGWAALLSIVAGAGIYLSHAPGWQFLAATPLHNFDIPRALFTGAIMGWVADFGVWLPLLGFALLHADPKLQLEKRWLAIIALGHMIGLGRWSAGPMIGVVPAATLLLSALNRAKHSPKRIQMLIWAVLGSLLLWRTLPHYPEALAWPHLHSSDFAPHGLASTSEVQRLWLLEAGFVLLICLSTKWRRISGPLTASALIFSIVVRSQLGSHALSTQTSVRAVAQSARSSQTQSGVASYGVEDPGWTFYAPPAWPRLTTAEQALAYLDQDTHHTLVLSQDSDLRLSGDLARIASRLSIQETGHPRLRLLRNHQQGGSPYLPQTALLKRIPDMQHPCSVIFDDALELLGWSLCKNPRRGESCKFTAIFRVLEAQAGPRTLVAQIRQPPFSAWPPFGTPTLDGRFPVSQWQAGDIVRIEQTWEVPRLLSRSGTYELRIGLAKSRYHFVPITHPSQDPPLQSGLRWLGSSHKHIVLGKVSID